MTARRKGKRSRMIDGSAEKDVASDDTKNVKRKQTRMTEWRGVIRSFSKASYNTSARRCNLSNDIVEAGETLRSLVTAGVVKFGVKLYFLRLFYICTSIKLAKT